MISVFLGIINLVLYELLFISSYESLYALCEITCTFDVGRDTICILILFYPQHSNSTYTDFCKFIKHVQ